MTFRHPLIVALARALNGAFFVMTAAYAVLNASAFAYYQFIRPELFGWLPAFVAINHEMYWVALLVTSLTLIEDLRRWRWSAWSYIAASAALGSWLIFNPVLSTVGYGPRSLTVAVVALVPVVWLAIVDHALAGAPSWALTGGKGGEQRVLRACGVAALLVWGLYGVAIPWRLHAALGVDLTAAALLMALANSLVAHLVVFAILYLAMVVIMAGGAITGSGGIEYGAVAMLSAAVVTVVFHEVVCVAMSFGGADSWIASAAFAVALTIAWSGVAWRRARAVEARSLTALDVWLSPMAPITGGRWRAGAAVGAVALPFAAYALATSVEQLDWNFLLQKLGVFVIWLIAFGLAHRLVRARAKPAGLWAALLPPAAVLMAFVSAEAAQTRVRAWSGDARLDPEFVLDRYAAVDPSFHLISDLLRANSGEGAEFYGYLKTNSTIATQIKPVTIDFVNPIGPAAARRPHIFLFVVDSLRRDYVSAYNPAVTFTPALGEFARDSFVFERAYTRYGGTGLAVPSIWSGGMLMHKQYVRPFEPMDTLSKLLAAGDYRRIMSYDSVVSALVPRVAALTELDRGKRNLDFDLCSTLPELAGRLEATRDDPRPVFAYSLPQTVHFAVVMFQKPMPATDAYSGFFAPVATGLQKTDRCFGHFVDGLKRSGMYDDSIIIVTSDHGDSLGEQGRWGHAYTVFPEVMRVPLIVHLPAWLRSSVTTDLARPAFLTDITPTLYALLGYAPAPLGSLYGAPLFVPPDQAPGDRRHESFLLASSYGSVYGTLRHNGRALYIADAIDGRDYAYDTRDNGVGVRVQVTEAMRAINWDLIRGEIGRLAAQYHFSP